VNYKILLRFVAVPAISGSVLASWLLVGYTSKAHAVLSPNQASCSLPQAFDLGSPNLQSLLHQRFALLVASNANVVPDEFSPDFSEAESDAAVALFGCDCPACLNVLQQLRRQSLTPKGEGHCMKNLARRVSPEKTQQILKTLEADEAKNNL
jgi:hypothetical protein